MLVETQEQSKRHFDGFAFICRGAAIGTTPRLSRVSPALRRLGHWRCPPRLMAVDIHFEDRGMVGFRAHDTHCGISRSGCRARLPSWLAAAPAK